MGDRTIVDAKSMGSIKTKGFTLIELLIVFIIVGLLASIAIPIYRANIKKVASTEAAGILGTVLTAQKIYFAQHNTYCSDEDLLEVDLSGSKYFDNIVIVNADNNGFIAKTTGKGICQGVEVVMEYTNAAGASIIYHGF